jgi:hypothetical protein
MMMTRIHLLIVLITTTAAVTKTVSKIVENDIIAITVNENTNNGEEIFLKDQLIEDQETRIKPSSAIFSSKDAEATSYRA